MGRWPECGAQLRMPPAWSNTPLRQPCLPPLLGHRAPSCPPTQPCRYPELAPWLDLGPVLDTEGSRSASPLGNPQPLSPWSTGTSVTLKPPNPTGDPMPRPQNTARLHSDLPSADPGLRPHPHPLWVRGHLAPSFQNKGLFRGALQPLPQPVLRAHPCGPTGSLTDPSRPAGPALGSVMTIPQVPRLGPPLLCVKAPCHQAAPALAPSLHPCPPVAPFTVTHVAVCACITS